ncbi:MAG: polysaccharide deacetylase family protein [Acidobacteriota bacterium]|nr:polysaccharide deacetylase family protein [Acidobacteriota bacterium]
MLIFTALGMALVALAHMAPFPFLLEIHPPAEARWHMPAAPPGAPPRIYLTFDDGPNPATTPDLLDVLARDHVRATFFLIDAHVTPETAPIVRRMFDEGHAVGLHSDTREWMLLPPDEVAARLARNADRIAQLTGHRPCPIFRPHAGWRGGELYQGVAKAGYSLVGWSWMMWDWNWFRTRTPESIVHRALGHAGDGAILVMHDGDESHPRRDQRQTVEATARLIPALEARGFAFGTLCGATSPRTSAPYPPPA